MTLFKGEPQPERVPLAARLRPTCLADFVGQRHLLGEGSQVRVALERGSLGSVILWGPAGSGKTTLARLIAQHADAHLVARSAVTAGVADIRKTADEAKHRQRATILFLDEIHHFTRTQQDFLLGYIEDGSLTLIGATTENPTFSLATPLLSRCRVLVLKPLDDEDVRKIALRGAAEVDAELDEDALEMLARFSNGDARVALNAVEFGQQLAHPSRVILPEHVSQSLNRPVARYDKKGDQHYDVISAFIKSVRGSDVDAALHYLARMIRAGEDPRFIARRLVILASEDVGNAAPMALLVATAAFQAVERIGMPESRIILAQATVFLAASPKSNSAYLGIEKALSDLDRVPPPRVPDYLRHPNTLRYDIATDAEQYRYPHDFGGWVAQEYLPPGHGLNLPYYVPIHTGYETKIAAFLTALGEEPQKE